VFDSTTRVLVVDDMMTMRKIVIRICKELGFTDITEAPNGAEAWQKIAESKTPFDLIISDWNMPVSTGLDLLKRVRADSRVSKTPFVMVTAEAEQHQILEAVTAKVSSYVVKPFTAETMRGKLEAVHKALDPQQLKKIG
jgi:two-component system, chemotaxis family, chemotaxis protein CheY